MCGLPAAGKTTAGRQLERDHNAVRLTLDEWMLQLYPLRYDEPAYADAASRCKALMLDLADRVLQLGISVILDWNHWSRSARADASRWAGERGAALTVVYVDVPVQVAIAQAAARADELAHHLDAASVRHATTYLEVPEETEGVHIIRWRADGGLRRDD